MARKKTTKKSPAKPPKPPKKAEIEQLLAILKGGRDASMREKAAVFQKEYMIARRVLEEAYSGYEAHELPVDLQRLRRDLSVNRDSLVDESKAEIQAAFETTERLVLAALKEQKREPPAKPPKGTLAKFATDDDTFIMRLMDEIDRKLLSAGDDGMMLSQLRFALGGALETKHVVRALQLLRADERVSIKGIKRGARYVHVPIAAA